MSLLARHGFEFETEFSVAEIANMANLSEDEVERLLRLEQ